jgi:hypothetical protein
MILLGMKRRIFTFRILAFSVVLACAASAAADKKPQQQVKPMAGPRATALRVTSLYITPSTEAQRVDRVQIGREMVVAEKSGAWMRVYANTDIEEQHSDKDEPMVGGNETTPPISGWIEAKGVVEETTPNGDQILMGAAANMETEASDPRGPANAAQSARLTSSGKSSAPTPRLCPRRTRRAPNSASRWMKTRCTRSSSTIQKPNGRPWRPST